jgi:MFS transporter, DHA3 family, macrolide efflux protein
VSVNRNFVLLWHGQLVSQLGNQAFLIATAFYLVERTGSALSVAALMIGATLPLVLLGPLAGAVADRHSRRSILIVTDLIRAASIGGLAAVVLWQPVLTSPVLTIVVGVATFNGVMLALFAPAYQALIPELVPAEDLGTANAISQMSGQAATLIGQAAGGVFYAWGGIAPLLVIDALSFAYAAFATWFIPPDRPAEQGRRDVMAALERYLADTREGLLYVWRGTGMAVVLGIFSGVNCLFMPVFVLLPFYARETLNAGPQWYGFLLSGSGLGALVGSLMAGIVLRTLRHRAGLVRLCLCGVAASVLMLAMTTSPWVALALFVAIGSMSSMINVTVITAFQTAVDVHIRGRVMALLIALSMVATPIGIGLGGVLGDIWRSSLSLVIAGSGVAIAVLGGLSWVARGFDRLFDE